MPDLADQADEEFAMHVKAAQSCYKSLDNLYAPSEYCGECGELLPPIRIQYGICVSCKTCLELRAKLYNKRVFDYEEDNRNYPIKV